MSQFGLSKDAVRVGATNENQWSSEAVRSCLTHCVCCVWHFIRLPFPLSEIYSQAISMRNWNSKWKKKESLGHNHVTNMSDWYTADTKKCQDVITVSEPCQKCVSSCGDHLHANCRLALRLRMDPHALKAVHWYTPVSWSLSRLLMIRLPPDMWRR